MSTYADVILAGDALATLRTLPDGCVQTCVTSPPYWGLRDYGVPGQLGLEATPEAYVARMVEVFREVRRVLRDDGTLWLNLGDSYAGGTERHTGRNDTDRPTPGGRGGSFRGGARNVIDCRAGNYKAKDLIGIPWMVAFALRADGWYLRSDIIWHKPNPMPESVRDRPTKAHEYLFLLSKRERYYYDADAIREPHSAPFRKSGPGALRGQVEIRPRGNLQTIDEQSYNPAGRNKRSVWTVATAPYAGAHFATFPPALIEPCILAGAPAGGLVLDPFFGSGTVGAVARRHSRHYLGIELSPAYIALAEQRIASERQPVMWTAGLGSSVVTQEGASDAQTGMQLRRRHADGRNRGASASGQVTAPRPDRDGRHRPRGERDMAVS